MSFYPSQNAPHLLIPSLFPGPELHDCYHQARRMLKTQKDISDALTNYEIRYSLWEGRTFISGENSYTLRALEQIIFDLYTKARANFVPACKAWEKREDRFEDPLEKEYRTVPDLTCTPNTEFAFIDSVGQLCQDIPSLATKVKELSQKHTCSRIYLIALQITQFFKWVFGLSSTFVEERFPLLQSDLFQSDLSAFQDEQRLRKARICKEHAKASWNSPQRLDNPLYKESQLDARLSNVLRAETFFTKKELEIVLEIDTKTPFLQQIYDCQKNRSATATVVEAISAAFDYARTPLANHPKTDINLNIAFLNYETRLLLKAHPPETSTSSAYDYVQKMALQVVTDALNEADALRKQPPSSKLLEEMPLLSRKIATSLRETIQKELNKGAL